MAERRESWSSNEDEEDKETEERCWSDVHEDILSLIKVRLFAGDLSTFNMVCKSWQSTQCIRPLPPPIECQHRQSPCLMFIHRDRDTITCKLFHPIYNGFYDLETPAIYGAEIRFSKYGWLLMSRGDLSVFFFNPFSKAAIELPTMPLPVGFDAMCFSSQPTSSDCLVVGVTHCPWISIAILRRGERNWSVFGYENPQNYWLSDCSLLLYKDLYYCLTVSGVLGVYDPNSESWNFQGKPFHDSIYQSFLVEMNGQLLAVFVVSDEKRRLHVCKFDFKKMVWQKVRSLGDKMLYVSRSSSFAEIATVNGMANKIYLPNLCGDNGVFYSVSTRKYHSFGGDFSSNMACNKFRALRFSTWIKPPLETNCDKELCW